VRVVPEGQLPLGLAEGRAVLFEDARRTLYLSEGAVELREARLRGLIRHETAHFAVWERHGTEVQMHGKTFTKVCREHARSTDCKGLSE
jgi:hypothetical protein